MKYIDEERLRNEIVDARRSAESSRTNIEALDGNHWQTLPEYIAGTNVLATGTRQFDNGELKLALERMDSAKKFLHAAYSKELQFLNDVAQETYRQGLEYADVNGNKRDDVLAVRYLLKAKEFGISEAGETLYSFCVHLQDDRAQTIAECRAIEENKLIPSTWDTLRHCDELLKRLRNEADALRELPFSDNKSPPVMTQHALKEHEAHIEKIEATRKRLEDEISFHDKTIMKTIALPDGVTMEMIYCKPGEYVSGDSNTPTKMDHGFWLGRYAVTQRQWQSVMGDNPAEFKGCPNNPVENVSWNDCQEFIRRVEERAYRGVRLPTEQEWEYACRAGTRTTYSWGDALNGDLANCNGTAPHGTGFVGKNEKKTVEVGCYKPNAWGFYCMHGNVWEWCNDRFDDRKMVVRGGSWYASAYQCRSASRLGVKPDDRVNTVGFRLCLLDSNTASRIATGEAQDPM